MTNILPPSALETITFSVLYLCEFKLLYSTYNEIMYYLYFCTWLILLNILSFRCIHLVANDRISFSYEMALYSFYT